jgi:hypothetical protein
MAIRTSRISDLSGADVMSSVVQAGPNPAPTFFSFNMRGRSNDEEIRYVQPEELLHSITFE